MKFVFYYDSKKGKKKQQTIKAKTSDELMRVATVAKCELTKKSILKDLDFTDINLVCEADGKKMNMKELLNSITSKKKVKKDDTKSNDKSKKDKKKKKKSSEKKKKKKKDKIKNIEKDYKPKTNSDGLIKITRRK